MSAASNRGSKPRLLDLFCGAGGAAIEQRFFKYVDRRGVHDCWPWRGSFRENGYGQFNIKRYPYKAHRVAYAIFAAKYGHDFDESLGVLHTCDRPHCVNPLHLFLGTQADNMGDAARKRRTWKKLSENDVRAIRANAWEGARPLARAFGVSHRQILRILHRESRADVV